MNFFNIFFCLALAVYSVAGDCWETSNCQLDSWQTKGCGQYGRVEQSRRPCNGGNFYTCCTSASGPAPATGGTKSGKTTRYWDCCKPSCSWNGKAPVTSPVTTCAKDGFSVLSDRNAQSGCDGGGAYVCNNQQPFAVNDNLAYGFAAASISGQGEYQGCCACYELTFTSGPVNGKKLVVQVTNVGADLGENHFDLQIPGGGVGLFNGCKPQWGTSDNGWGQKYGGVSSAAECNQLPAPLQAGCNFRFGWFKNADNPTMTFKPVTCPNEITSRSGCTRTA